MLHHIYNTAIKQWSFPLSHNPVSNVQKPKCNPPRERRLSDNELKYIDDMDEKSKIDPEFSLKTSIDDLTAVIAPRAFTLKLSKYSFS